MYGWNQEILPSYVSLPDTGIAPSFSQNLLTLQRKLEEQEAALLGRTQVIELLQQELNAAEQQNQVPFHVLFIALLLRVSGGWVICQ